MILIKLYLIILVVIKKFERCWRNYDGKWVLKENSYIEDWDNEKKQQIINELYIYNHQGGIVLGAFYNNKLIGFSSVGIKLFGEYRQYLELIMMLIKILRKR